MTTARTFDLLVVGGGAGGLAAAREARRRGASVALVSDGPPGGDCTFTGCVPSKTLIEAARRGLSRDDAWASIRPVVDHIAGSESAEVLRSEGVEVVEGRGTLRDSTSLVVDGAVLSARRGVVLALGASAAIPPIPGLREAAEGTDPLVRTNETFWELAELPDRFGILGAGAIGCELALALATLGVRVHVFELADRVLPGEEPDVSAIIDARLRAAGVTVHLGTAVTRVEASGRELRVQIDGGVTVDRLLVAAGRRPRTSGTGLAAAGVALTDGGAIEVGATLETSTSGIYAVGDVVGGLQFTHAADAMGRLAAGNALGALSRVRPARFDPSVVPWVTFTDPEIARIGVTEAEAVAIRGAMVAELPLHEHDRALVAEATDGFIRIIAAPRRGLGMLGGGRVVGATIVAPRAGEMIAELALAMRLGAFTGRLAQTVHPYPTWSYGIQKTVGQFFTAVEGRTARPPRG